MENEREVSEIMIGPENTDPLVRDIFKDLMLIGWSGNLSKIWCRNAIDRFFMHPEVEVRPTINTFFAISRAFPSESYRLVQAANSYLQEDRRRFLLDIAVIVGLFRAGEWVDDINYHSWFKSFLSYVMAEEVFPGGHADAIPDHLKGMLSNAVSRYANKWSRTHPYVRQFLVETRQGFEFSGRFEKAGSIHAIQKSVLGDLFYGYIRNLNLADQLSLVKNEPMED